jgi:hypothetical protein
MPFLRVPQERHEVPHSPHSPHAPQGFLRNS